MATVRQIGDLVTTQLRDRVDELVSAVEDDAADLAEVAGLAKEVREAAERIEAIYSDLDRMLTRGLEGKALSELLGQASDSPQREQNGSGADDVTKEDLLERARDANIQGRSSMTKGELAEAVEAEESQTKEELLERARVADIEGRSSMTKEELRTALRDAGA